MRWGQLILGVALLVCVAVPPAEARPADRRADKKRLISVVPPKPLWKEVARLDPLDGLMP